MDIPNTAQKMIDFTLVFVSIFVERANGLSTPIAEIAARHGFRSEADFWETFLSETSEIELFIHKLRDCLILPAFLPTTDPTTGRPMTWMDKVRNDEAFLRRSMKDASNQQESFFVEGRDGNTYVRPREAVEWLLATPTRRALVPPALKEHLHPTNGTPLKAPRGRKPKLNDDDLRAAFEVECKARGGHPDKDGPDGWTTQADVERWLSEWADSRNTPVGESSARGYARALLTKANN